MSEWACLVWRQAGFNPCSGAGQGPLFSMSQLSQFRKIQVIHNLLLCPKQLPPYTSSISMNGVIMTPLTASTPE